MDHSQALIKKALGDKYEIKDLIQSGGMGKIFLGIHRALGRKVAIKIIHQELVKNEDFKIRFYREAKLAASLDHHGIIDIYDFGSNDNFDYIIMPFIDGETLKDCIKARGAFEMSEALDLMIKMTDALHYAHQHNVYHRDIKPANIMFDDRGRVVITDFGISKEIGDTDLTAANTVLGSPRYMSPEQIKGEPVDARSDLYSLGLVFYEMITGKHPFQGKDVTALYYAQAHEIPARPETGTAHMPKALGNIIMRLLEKKPEKRYADGGELLEDLSDIQQEKTKVSEDIDDATIVDIQATLKDDATIIDDATIVGKNDFPDPKKQGQLRPESATDAESSKSRNKVIGLIRSNKKKLAIGGAVFLVLFLVLFFLPGQSSKNENKLESEDDAISASANEKFTKHNQDVMLKKQTTDFPDQKPITSGVLFEKLLGIGNAKHSSIFNVWTDRKTYRIGQPIRFYFEAEEPCYAVILTYTTDNELIQVFPNYYRSNQFVQPGRKYEIPDERMDFDLQVTGPAGTDTIIALISKKPFDLLGSSFSEGNPFLSVNENDSSKIKNIFKYIQSIQYADIYSKHITYGIQ